MELKLEVRVILQKKKLTVNNGDSTLGGCCKVSHTTRFYIAVSGNGKCNGTIYRTILVRIGGYISK